VADRERLEHLTDRWRARHDARRPAVDERPLATADREAIAARSFPFRAVTPEAYVAERGPSMTGFTFDDASYRDAELDRWIVEVGRLLRSRWEGR
jgi:hypothetical protein